MYTDCEHEVHVSPAGDAVRAVPRVYSDVTTPVTSAAPGVATAGADVTDRATARRAAAPRLMRNAVQRYDWGSRTALARLQGRRPDGRTEAELWMGAHPLAPSRLRDLDGRETCLADEVAADPAGTLGAACLDRFGPRLPFLLKVLAIDRALSVQVHPDAAQAAAGWADQEARPGGPRRFTDPWPKPELLVAVTHVEALAGWRPRATAAALLDLLDGPRAERLRATVVADGVPAALAALASWPAGDRPALADEVAAAVRVALAGNAVERDPGPLAALMWVSRLSEQHPGDPLVLAPLLLELHLLAPGNSLFVPAGVAHAYLSGIGVEIMGASDNVVRAGLTTKDVDVPLLLDLLRPDAAPLLADPVPAGPSEAVWAPPAREFRLSRLRVAPDRPVVPADLPGAAAGPQILLCLTGAVEVVDAGHRVAVRAGESVFLAAGGGAVRVVGDGEVYRACLGTDG